MSGASRPRRDPDGRGGGGSAWWLKAAAEVGRRPSLWRIAAFEAIALAPRGWWRHWPPAPVPSPGWLAFRMETAYGDPDARPVPEDVVAFLDWCRMSRRRAWLR
ncbi:MAG: hypothetical protein ABSF89_04380 [Acidimicrobiales bacterium]